MRNTSFLKMNCHQGDDVCALEHELSLEARISAAKVAPHLTIEEEDSVAPERSTAAAAHKDKDKDTDRSRDRSLSRRMPGDGENFEVPVVLMTVGWDPAGDPTHREDALGRDRTCVFRVLDMPRVVKWFTSHTRYDSHTDGKVSVQISQSKFFF